MRAYVNRWYFILNSYLIFISPMTASFCHLSHSHFMLSFFPHWYVFVILIGFFSWLCYCDLRWPPPALKWREKKTNLYICINAANLKLKLFEKILIMDFSFSVSFHLSSSLTRRCLSLTISLQSRKKNIESISIFVCHSLACSPALCRYVSEQSIEMPFYVYVHTMSCQSSRVKLLYFILLFYLKMATKIWKSLWHTHTQWEKERHTHTQTHNSFEWTFTNLNYHK